MLRRIAKRTLRRKWLVLSYRVSYIMLALCATSHSLLEGPSMKSILLSVPDQMKAQLDAKRAEGYSLNGFIRMVLAKALTEPPLSHTDQIVRRRARRSTAR